MNTTHTHALPADLAQLTRFPDYGLTPRGELFRLSTFTQLTVSPFRRSPRNQHPLGTTKRHYIDEMMIETFHPDIDRSMISSIRHKDGNLRNDSLDNLEAVRVDDNLLPIGGLTGFRVNKAGHIFDTTKRLAHIHKRFWTFVPINVNGKELWLNVPVAILNTFGDLGFYNPEDKKDTFIAKPKPNWSQNSFVNANTEIVVPASVDHDNTNTEHSNWYWRRLRVNPALENDTDWKQLDRLLFVPKLGADDTLPPACWQHGIETPCPVCTAHPRVALSLDCSGCPSPDSCESCPVPGVPLTLSRATG